MAVAKYKSDVRTLTGSSESAVSAHVYYNFVKTSQNDWRAVVRSSSCNAAQLPFFLSYLFNALTVNGVTRVVVTRGGN